MGEFVPQTYPLWLAYRDGDRVWAGRVIAWLPNEAAGTLEPWVAAEGANGVAVGALPAGVVDWWLGDSRFEAVQAVPTPPRALDYGDEPDAVTADDTDVEDIDDNDLP